MKPTGHNLGGGNFVMGRLPHKAAEVADIEESLFYGLSDLRAARANGSNAYIVSETHTLCVKKIVMKLRIVDNRECNCYLDRKQCCDGGRKADETLTVTRLSRHLFWRCAWGV